MLSYFFFLVIGEKKQLNIIFLQKKENEKGTGNTDTHNCQKIIIKSQKTKERSISSREKGRCEKKKEKSKAR